uniref:SFRICE_013680 n=1 Tax=Spodoptera frugiperda TaxID=7108 RepID=A0A2H1VJ53_SPOFR
MWLSRHSRVGTSDDNANNCIKRTHRQEYKLSNLVLVTESLTFMAGTHNLPALLNWYRRWTPAAACFFSIRWVASPPSSRIMLGVHVAVGVQHWSMHHQNASSLSPRHANIASLAIFPGNKGIPSGPLPSSFTKPLGSQAACTLTATRHFRKFGSFFYDIDKPLNDHTDHLMHVPKRLLLHSACCKCCRLPSARSRPVPLASRSAPPSARKTTQIWTPRFLNAPSTRVCSDTDAMPTRVCSGTHTLVPRVCIDTNDNKLLCRRKTRRRRVFPKRVSTCTNLSILQRLIILSSRSKSHDTRHLLFSNLDLPSPEGMLFNVPDAIRWVRLSSCNGLLVRLDPFIFV